MQINRITPVSYKAGIPKDLYTNLSIEARRRGQNVGTDVFLQSKNIEKWGLETSSLVMLEKRTTEGTKRTLALTNNFAAPFKNAVLPAKGSILDTFLSLKEKDITQAENSLQI